MNAKLREGGKKEEKRRLKEFVENAYRCDPRVIAHKEAQRAERCARALSLCWLPMRHASSGHLLDTGVYHRMSSVYHMAWA